MPVRKNPLDLVRGTLDVLILKAVVWGPLHGYGIVDLIRRQTGDALAVDDGTLYPALWRLENKGLLEAEWGVSENNRKAKYYRLTAAGRRRLAEQTRMWDAYSEAVNSVLHAARPPAAGEA